MAGKGRVLGERGRARWLVTRALLVVALSASSTLAADSDGDGLDDGWEQQYFGGLSAEASADPDGDGLTNADEYALGSDPTRFDTDGDGLSDGRERDLRTDPTLRDTDGDGLTDYAETQVHHTNPRRRDSDGGGRGDGEEVVIDGTDPLLASDDALDSDGDGLTNQQEISLGTNPFATDTDGDLLNDDVEDANHDGRYQGDLNENGHYEPELGEETDPTRADTDGDGLNDGLELLRGTDPFDTDSDDDGISDGDENALSIDTYTCLNPARADSDGDGVNDGAELAAHLNPCDPDSDGDGVLDGVEIHDGTDPAVPGAGTDTDGDGLTDAYETDVSGTDPTLADSDGDGLSDAEEVFPLHDTLVTNALDADTDDDGLLDGNESVVVGNQVTFRSNPLLSDSDGDGLLDGQERGLSAPEVSALDPDATDPLRFVADTDPSTTTNPLELDTDGDGLADGVEDANHDGLKQATETDPNVFDTDGDGLSDGQEVQQNGNSACGQAFDPTNPNDGAADFDGDGLPNYVELNLTVRVDLVLIAAPTDPCNPDTDGDGLSDRVEATSSYVNGQTNPTVADTDGDGIPDGLEDADHNGRRAAATETDPTSNDSDGDGLRDGVEDANHNGVVDSGETDPRVADSDGDGLDDGTEVFRLGTDPLNTDSDGDGISDGRERGLDGDADPASRTDPLAKDTDGDGLDDGVEDADHNGRVDQGETNPTDRDSDDGGVSDGQEVLMDGTDPNDPKDDKLGTGSTPEIPDDLRPDANPVELPEETDPEPDPRFFLEPNAEIRGSSCSVVAAGEAGNAGAPLGLMVAAVAIGALRRRARRGARAASWLGLLGSLFAAALAGKARAQTPDQIATARNTNIDANPHRINPAGFELLGVSRPRVLPHLALRAAASFNYLTGPAVVADRTTGDTLRKLVANREEAELGFALGIADRFQVSLMAPAVLHQRAELPGQNLGTATSSGFGNPTIVPRAVIVGAGDGPFALGVEVPVTLPVYDTPAYMGYDGWGVEPRLLTEGKAGPVVISTAIGTLFKPEQRIFNLRDGNQLTYGLSTMLPDAVKSWDFGAEFQGATPLDRPGLSAETRGEVLIGARHRIDDRLSVSTGGGAGVMSGVGQSGYRVFVSVGYAASLVGAPNAENEDARKPDCSAHHGVALPPGCPPPDADHDGIPDAVDKCPNDPEDKDGFEDQDGCPDLDNDQDGLKDSEDGCPNEPEDRDGYKDADGCPEPDNDGDGILDAADKCPNDPEDEPGPDADGCPKQMAKLCPDGARPTASGECLAHIDAGLIQISEPVQFEEGTATLKDASRELLNQVVDILDANKDMKVQVVGHTDSWGLKANNLELSRERARSVRFYLIRQSKDPTRMAKNVRSLGKGESEPIESNDTAVGRAKNRRVEFVIVGK